VSPEFLYAMAGMRIAARSEGATPVACLRSMSGMRAV
jgi:hypothetical protein